MSDTPGKPHVVARREISFIDTAEFALRRSREREGLNINDIVNRAVQFYDELSQARAEGDEIILHHPNGATDLWEWE
jgi:molybdopterin converting factor small subunit